LYTSLCTSTPEKLLILWQNLGSVQTHTNR
jgi:hypothetical protein